MCNKDLQVSKRGRKENNDQLSQLPDEILLDILSLLPFKYAIVTSALSRRWRWLWTHLPNIDISINSDFRDQREEFSSAMDHLLSKFTSQSIQRFSLDLGNYREDLFLFNKRDRNYANFPRWFDWLCKRKQVRELRFRLRGGPRFPNYHFPDHPMSIFQISSLVVLHLTPWFLTDEDYDASNALFHLPNLKHITVELFAWNAVGLEKLVSSSPSLQHLSLLASFVTNKEYHTLNISNPSLKRLEINLGDPIVVVINTPNLEYVSVHFHFFNQNTSYQVSFVNPPPRLCTSSLWTWSDYRDDIFMPSSNLFTVISNVTSLTVTDTKPTPLMAPTTFTRLTRLKLRLSTFINRHEGALFSGLSLLHQCPVLEVLIFDMSGYSGYFSPYPQPWSSPDSTPKCLVTSVKRIEIVACSFVYELENALLGLLNYLLGSTKVLELLRINFAAHSLHKYRPDQARSDELHFLRKLLEFHVTFPHCSLEVSGIYHKLMGGVIKPASSVGSLQQN
ncbi:F-box/FBD/LRR-repeat protein At1g51370-like [Silene latifolia]|uniref:F-box/FBD/LRR-repeat protein At1g51370-like n=1 Tax=Silene latifolia TaxID=37657 RepID=UPI003D77448E